MGSCNSSGRGGSFLGGGSSGLSVSPGPPFSVPGGLEVSSVAPGLGGLKLLLGLVERCLDWLPGFPVVGHVGGGGFPVGSVVFLGVLSPELSQSNVLLVKSIENVALGCV